MFWWNYMYMKSKFPYIIVWELQKKSSIFIEYAEKKKILSKYCLLKYYCYLKQIQRTNQNINIYTFLLVLWQKHGYGREPGNFDQMMQNAVAHICIS